MKKNLFAISVSTLALFFAASVNAQTDPQSDVRDETRSGTFPRPMRVDGPGGYRPSVGLKMGVANPEGSYDSAAEVGVDVGFQPYVPFGFGATFATSKNASQTTAQDLERTSILARGTYNFGGSTPIIRHSWVGVAAGPVFRRDGTDLGLAPVAGFDVPIQDPGGSYFSLGADAKYLALVNSDDSDSLTVTGVLKYWF